MRQYSPIDKLLSLVDESLRTTYGRPATTERDNPGDAVADNATLDEHERALSGRLMRVNHAGEVSAQGLYQGQALGARRQEIQAQMRRSAQEENDHLAWCEKRINELGTHKSYLAPFWYWGSFGIGACAGAIGDKWSLGFVTETEHQVVRHLDEHLKRLPAADERSRAILEQMKEDEAHHAHVAIQAGAADLPMPVKKLLMPLMATFMTKTSFWI